MAASGLGGYFIGAASAEAEIREGRRVLQMAAVAYNDEHARFADAVRLLQNLGMATEQVLTAEQLENAAVAEAIEQAKQRIKEWNQ